jgi:F-type H+-transporting ATPase subunit gamma
MRAARPYAERIRTVIGHLRFANPDFKHPFLVEREVTSVGYIVISSDRGLCGGLNTNLFKSVVTSIREWQNKGAAVHVSIVGAKALQFFRRLSGINTTGTISGMGDHPHAADLIGSVKVMLDMYAEGKLDRLFLVSNTFVNTMTQQPTLRQLLPVIAQDEDKLQKMWDYLYEPSAAELLDGLLMRYIESQVYQGTVENKACEMAARMVAMKAASDNAGNLIDELQLIYNKARQAAITKELSEIVGGAAAV